jgi:peptidoglycan/xylan/chitin deacetylase (PgdA/CDA1 family)
MRPHTIPTPRPTGLIALGAMLATLYVTDALSAPPKPKPVSPVTGCTTPGPEVVTHGPGGRKRVALTFDDGPKRRTEPILDQLERFDVHATFFVVGGHVAGDEELLQRMLEDGHEIGNHTLHHTAHANAFSLRKTNEVVRDATGGFTPCHFRPPYGNDSNLVIGAARKAHLQTVMWTVDSLDHKGIPTGPIFRAGAMYRNVMNGVSPGAIILLHDGGYNRKPTERAVPLIVKGLRQRGYDMVTVTQLLGGRMIERPKQKKPGKFKIHTSACSGGASLRARRSCSPARTSCTRRRPSARWPRTVEMRNTDAMATVQRADSPSSRHWSMPTSRLLCRNRAKRATPAPSSWGEDPKPSRRPRSRRTHWVRR